MARPRLTAISDALDDISYEWMVETHPRLVEAIEAEVRRGATPEQVRRHVMASTFRAELALRCEQVARFFGREETERAEQVRG